MSDYAHYGNPLKELELEDAPKKFKDETVRDEKGRRRFHGAFTGGFSAGYFNSVDTKEGWAPSQFISSRSNRADKPQQRPQDYMDTEDLGELGFAPQRLQLQDGARVASDDKHEPPIRSSGFGSQRELLSVPLRRILKGDRDSIGVLILRGMGWRDGKGIGPKVCLKAGYGPQLPQHLAEAEIGPDDIEFTEIQGTDKVWGLGYTPATRLDLFGDKVDRERVTQTTAKVAGRRLGIRGQAFGVGAFEEDDEDIYAKDDMTQYAFEEVDHSRGERSRTPKHPMIEANKKPSLGGILEGFVAVEVQAKSSSGSSILIPPDWKPKQIVAGGESNASELSKQQKVDALFRNLPEGSVFNFLSEEARAKIEATKKAISDRRTDAGQCLKRADRAECTDREEPDVPNREQTVEADAKNVKTFSGVDVTTLRPFAREPTKQERFERYIAFAEKGHREMLASIQPPHFSAWEAALEKKEFEAALLIVRPTLGLTNRFESRPTDNPHSALPTGLASASEIAPAAADSAAEAASKGPPVRALKEFGAQTHTRFTWHPASVLCKRFNVPDPYPGQDFVGIPSSSLLLDHLPEIGARAEEEKAEVDETARDRPTELGVSNASTYQSELLTRATPVLAPKARDVVLLNEAEDEKSPPSMDIFKMIFSDDEEENEALDEAKEEEKQEEEEEMHNQTSSNAAAAHEIRSTPADAERKNTGIFANIDLSVLNKRPPPKPTPNAFAEKDRRQEEAEEKLAPMGPKPPPILAVESETLHKLIAKKLKKKHKEKYKKRKKDIKSKRKSKKKERHGKRKRNDSSSDSSQSDSVEDSEDDNEDDSETLSRMSHSKKQVDKKKMKKKKEKVKKKKKKKRHRERSNVRASSSSSSEKSDCDSDGGSDERQVDEQLKKKLRSLRSSC